MAATNASKLAAAKNDVAADSKDIVEDLKDLAEDGIGFFEDSLEVVKKSWVIRNPKNLKVALAIAAASGLSIGIVVGYLAVSKRMSVKWQKIADEEIESVKAHYALLRKDDVSLEELAAQYDTEKTEEIIKANGYVQYNHIVPSEEAQLETDPDEVVTITTDEPDGSRNVFDSDKPDSYFDYDEELQKRELRPSEPYVLTKQEFDENDPEYEQTTVTYFEDDDVLADPADQPVPETDNTVGDENLLRFGAGSGDPNIVYIRNDRMKIDFEVLKSNGSFANEVLGLRHSSEDKPGVRKFRLHDERRTIR